MNKGKSEEEIMLQQKDSQYENINVFLDIPYFLLDDVVSDSRKTEFYSDLKFIKEMYLNYEKGVNFLSEGSNGDYTPSDLRFKKASMIINKEARFCFANPPTFSVNLNDVNGNEKEKNNIIQTFLDNVLEKNKFNSKLIKGMKDCFIGERIAIVLNFDVEKGITISFLNSLSFYYELECDEIIKFVCFNRRNDTNSLKEQEWFKKEYVKKDDGIYLTERLYDGMGNVLETLIPEQKILLDKIPAVIILNDGLTGDINGESELKSLLNSEKHYSKLSNVDMDCLRKTMNPIRYTIDASEESTRNLSSSPGSYWDIQSDEEKATEHTAKVGMLEPSMKYSESLDTTLDRIENDMYAQCDVPNITNDKLQGIITSGKTIGALYWGLTVRCDEKMLAWEPELVSLAEMIIEGGKLYSDSSLKYLDDEKSKIPDIGYKIKVENNYSLPQDINEEKEVDMAEVELKLRSKKSYIKKWRNLTDEKADEELLQIKIEQQMFEESMLSYDTSDVAGVQDELDENYTNLSRRDNPENKNEEKSDNLDNNLKEKENE